MPMGDVPEEPVHDDCKGWYEDGRYDEAEATTCLVEEDEGSEEEVGYAVEEPGVWAPGVVDGSVEADTTHDDDNWA